MLYTLFLFNIGDVTMLTMQSLAKGYYLQFEYIDKVDGKPNDKVLRLKSDADRHLTALVERILNGAYDEYKIIFTYGCLKAIADSADINDIELDIYPTQYELLYWLVSSIYKPSYVVDAVIESGKDILHKEFNLFETIRQGYISELQEVYDIVFYWVDSKVTRNLHNQ